MALRVGIVAGEPSGDLLGAGLMRALTRERPDVAFTGVGGPRMLAAGLDPVFDMDRFVVNGFVEPLQRLPDLLRALLALRRHYLTLRPDLFVGVDFNVFNLLLERQLKRRGIRTVHYVSPSVYAWRRGRIDRIGRAADRVLALFPFEPPLYAGRGVDAVFVGHPLADDIAPVSQRAAARHALSLPADGAVIALLPGSRRGEIALLGDLMLDAAELLHAQLDRATFVVPCPSPAIQAAMAQRAGARPGLDLHLLAGDARLALAAADGALVKSGTGTLEAMLLGTPMVVTYRLGAVSYRIVRALKHSEYVAMPNILAGRLLVPELLQGDATPRALADTLLGEMRRAQAEPGYLAAFRRQHLLLRCGASARAARAALELLES